MAIKNYTTTISMEKSISEIQTKLAQIRARSISCDYNDDGTVISMSFSLMSGGELISFRITPNIAGVLNVLQEDKGVAPRLKSIDHAAMVAWRIEKDWVEAQIAKVLSSRTDVRELFLAYLQVEDGATLFSALQGKGFKQITGRID